MSDYDPLPYRAFTAWKLKRITLAAKDAKFALELASEVLAKYPTPESHPVPPTELQPNGDPKPLYLEFLSDYLYS